jgi:predicted phage baseplate assembly protein
MPLGVQEPVFDRSFDDLYAELRARIPRYNPAWTNFNDSDPGITLLQLFAWLGETLLHQMGQVPRKNYLKFAQLLGLELRGAQPATVQLTFTPKANERPATIPERSVYSAPVEGKPPLMFETVRSLDVIGAVLEAAAVHADGRVTPLPKPGPTGPDPFYPLGPHPEIGNALYLGFKPNPGVSRPFPRKMTFLALRPSSDTSGVPQRAGAQDRDLIAPVTLVWEYRPRADRDVWERLNVLLDETAALTRDGYVEVAGPEKIEPSKALGAQFPQPLYWLRVRLDQKSYPAGRAPRLEYLQPNAVDAVNLSTEKNADLGTSSGAAGQWFLLPRQQIESASLALIVRHGSKEQVWVQRPDFAASKPEDRHYVLNAASGRVTFGDGTHGLIPTAGDEIVALSFRWGGGAAGNAVRAGGVTGMVSQIAGIEKVTNVRAAAGGSDEQTLEDFERFAPSVLRQQGRAVTADDFAKVALAMDGVKQAQAIPARHPDFPGVEVPGAVTVVVVPDAEPDPAKGPPKPSAELIRSVCARLDRVRLITTEVYVAAPTFLAIRIEARLIAAPEAAFDEVAEGARARLDKLLDPRTWALGKDLSVAEVYRELFADPTNRIRSVENLLIYVDGRVQDVGGPLKVPPDAVVYGTDHVIVVERDDDGAVA